MSNLWVRFYLCLVMLVFTPVVGLMIGSHLLNVRNDFTVILGVITLVAIPPLMAFLFVKVVRTFKAAAEPHLPQLPEE